MQSQKRAFYTVDDTIFLGLFKKIEGDLADFSPAIKHLIAGGVALKSEDVKALARKRGRIIYQSSAQFDLRNTHGQFSITLTLTRALSQPNGNGNVVQLPSVEYIEASLDGSAHLHSMGDIGGLLLSIWRIVTEKLQPAETESVPPFGSNVFADAAISFSDASVNALETLHKTIAEVEKKRVALLEDAAESERIRRQKLEEELDKLAKEREEMRRQSHMSERRNIVGAISESLKKRQNTGYVPKSALAYRWGVFATALMLSSVAALFSYIAFEDASGFASASEISGKVIKLTSEENLQRQVLEEATSRYSLAFWLMFLKGLVGSLLSVGSLLFAVDWLRRGYHEDVEAARTLEKNLLDMSRASWIIETVLEVQHENKGAIPEQWINAVTRQLFDVEQSRHNRHDASDALAALLSFSAGGKFSSNGSEIYLNKSGARQLAAKADDE